MRARHLLVTSGAVTLAMAGLVAIPAIGASTPARITGVTAGPGPHAGEITISWNQSGANTTGFAVKTGLSTFSRTGSGSLPRDGRNAKIFTFPGKRHRITLSAAQVRAAGAAPETGNYLYFRLYAINTNGAGTATRWYPYLRAAMPRAVAPKSKGTHVRVASFNVLSARVSKGRSWLSRADEVAQVISSRNPGVVAIQELGPGRADGKTGSTTGHLRQTTSLENELSAIGAGRYKLVRTTPYVAPGTTHGTQGTRILYNTRKYSVVSDCRESTGKRNYSSTCSMNMPKLASDSEKKRRSAAWAELKDRSTGERFYVVSVHLDDRHSGNKATERVYDNLRERQVAAVYAKVHAIAGSQEIILAGDLNSWQQKAVSNAPHDYLSANGFYDAASALTKINIQYPTVNHFTTTQKAGAQGYGVRLDAIMVKGSRGASRWENVLDVVDSTRPSDHNMLVADLVL